MNKSTFNANQNFSSVESAVEIIVNQPTPITALKQVINSNVEGENFTFVADLLYAYAEKYANVPWLVSRNPNPYVVVMNPGQDDEDIVNDFPTLREARKCAQDHPCSDVMKRLDDGTLTTEF